MRFLDWLQLMLIGFKVLNLIEWSWLAVLAPTWFYLSLLIILLAKGVKIRD